MAADDLSIRDARLERAIADKTVMAIYLGNGVRLTGIVEKYDAGAIHLSSQNVPDGVTIERSHVSAVQRNITPKPPERKP